jgi:hypothetical protein
MRDFKGMKRQRGRNNRGGTGSGGKPQQHNANRAFDSNGPEGVKVRGAAQGVYEKYQQLARDATSSGDRVLAENYLQHAEHYFRVLRAIQPNRPVSDIIGKDAYSAYEIDFEAEPEEQPETPEPTQAEAAADGEGGEGFQGQGGEQRRDRFENRPREDRQRDDRPRDDRQRDDRPRDNNNQGRDRFDGQNNQGGQGQGQSRRDRWRDRDDRPRDDNRPRDDRPREDRPRDDRPRDERPRDDRPREDRPRDERPREDRPREERAPREDRFREERPREDRVREERPAPVEAVEAAPTEARRERPRRERAPRDRDPMAVIEPQATPLTSEAPSSPLLRSQDGDVSHAPAFLGRKSPRAAAPVEATPVAPATAEGEAPAKPKRRRAPRSFEGAAPESEEA